MAPKILSDPSDPRRIFFGINSGGLRRGGPFEYPRTREDMDRNMYIYIYFIYIHIHIYIYIFIYQYIYIYNDNMDKIEHYTVSIGYIWSVPFQDRVDQLEGQAKDAEMRWLG